MNLKKLERYLRVNLLEPGPRLMEKEFTEPRSHKGREALVYEVVTEMFPKSIYFWEIHNSAIIQVTFPSKYFPRATIRFCQQLYRCWKHSWKPFCKSLFSSSVAFLISRITKTLSLQCWYLSREQVKISWSPSQGSIWGCIRVVTLLLVRKFLTKTDRCAGALSWRRNRLSILHFLWRFLLATSLRRRRMSMYISSFTVAIAVNQASEFQEVLKYYVFLLREPLEGTSLNLQSCFTIGRVPWTTDVSWLVSLSLMPSMSHHFRPLG